MSHNSDVSDKSTLSFSGTSSDLSHSIFNLEIILNYKQTKKIKALPLFSLDINDFNGFKRLAASKTISLFSFWSSSL